MTISWNEVGKALADSAPILGGLLGGPSGAAVGSLIAAKLGTSSDPAAVMAQLKADPATLVTLKQLESDERKHLLAMQVETLRLELADTQSAREKHHDHWMPAFLTNVLLLMTVILTWSLFKYSIPDGNRDILVYIAGQIVTLAATGVAYWIGTSRSSHNKDKTLFHSAQ